jgi:GT2 family glycosyltransferase
MSKQYGYEAGRRAIEGNLRRCGVQGTVEPLPDFGFYRVRYPADTSAMISVIIPNKDEAEALRKCVDSVLQTGYENLEIIIVENNSTSREIFDLYGELKEHPKIRLVRWKGKGFNYSAINNYGASSAKGDYLLLLNNDTRILAPESLRRMEALCQRPQTGAVGALPLYPDGHVQHGGIILGHGGIAGHAWEGDLPQTDLDDYPALVFSHTHNVSAVTGACMMLRRAVWEQEGGMDESLAVTFNDVDLCMRLGRDSFRVLMCPGACLVHDESASRGSEDSREKVARFHKEIGIFVRRWEKELEMGDPCYNPCLTLLGRSWTCKDALRESVKPYVKYAEMFGGREM